MSRPAVGVTIAYDGRREAFFQLRKDYLRSVEQDGGLPLVLAPGGAGDAKELLKRLDALVLTGGDDVDPALYGEQPHASVRGLAHERDAFELALVREALERDLPLLAICRGHQVLNVAAGGTLIQDIPSQVAGALAHDPEGERWALAHSVRIEPGTRLRRILGQDEVQVNSFHHQAVKEIGRGLVVSARSPEDGVVEGIELPDRRFALGVQWHPESFWGRPEGFRPLFRALIEAAS
ncbi:MAG: gamma-glutamyl-gamma-aminobutyrate hydrolase family protein [Vicinamibacteria bacterium]